MLPLTLVLRPIMLVLKLVLYSQSTLNLPLLYYLLPQPLSNMMLKMDTTPLLMEVPSLFSQTESLFLEDMVMIPMPIPIPSMFSNFHAQEEPLTPTILLLSLKDISDVIRAVPKVIMESTVICVFVMGKDVWMELLETELVSALLTIMEPIVVCSMIALDKVLPLMELMEMDPVSVTAVTTEPPVNLDLSLVEVHGTLPLDPVLVLLDFMDQTVLLLVLVELMVFVKMELLEQVNVFVLLELILLLVLLLTVLKHVIVELVELVMMEIMELVLAFVLKELMELTVSPVQLVPQLLNHQMSSKFLDVMMEFKERENVSDFTTVLPLLQPFLV